MIATRRCTLVLATPAPFERGWIPDGIEEDKTGQLGDCAVKLVGASLGRFQHLGGWDIVRRRPRPTRRAVPAGSVYFLEIQDGDPATLFEACFAKSLCSDAMDQKLGLGWVYLGTW